MSDPVGIVDLQVSQNHNGGLDVFIESADLGLWHTWQTAPNTSTDAWSPWTGLAPPRDGVIYQGTVKTFVVARNGAGIQEIFTTADYSGTDPGRLGQKYVWRSAQSAPDSATWGAWGQMVPPPDYTDYQLTLRALRLNRYGLLELFASGPFVMFALSQGAVGAWYEMEWSYFGNASVYAQGGYAVGPGWLGLEVFAWGETLDNYGNPILDKNGNPILNETLWRIAEGHRIRIPGGPNPPGGNPPPNVPPNAKLYWDGQYDWENVTAASAPFTPPYFSSVTKGVFVNSFMTSSGLHVSRNPDGLLDAIAVSTDGLVYHNWQPYP